MACGLCDHALLLMMSTYGLGAGEVIGLQLQDIDWRAGTLQMSRPKTGVNFVLPLLPPVAKVLARYLRHGRPSHTPTRHLRPDRPRIRKVYGFDFAPQDVEKSYAELRCLLEELE